MPLVYLITVIFFASVPALAFQDASQQGCGTCNLFPKQVDIFHSHLGIRDMSRAPVVEGGRVPRHEASETTPNYEDEPSAIQIVPAKTGGTASVKRLSHKPPKAAKKAFDKSVDLSAKGQSLEAIAHLQKAIELDPQYMEALNNLGARYVLIGDYRRALSPLNQAVAIDPHSIQPYCNLSLAYLGLGDTQAAERAARQAIENDPSDMKGRYLLGISLVAQRKQAKEAVRNLRHAQDQFPQAQFAIAIAEAMAGNTAAAKASLHEYLALNQVPKRAQAEQLLRSLEAADPQTAR